jgi:Leucine-rich repeat (LRR) protein
LIQENFNTYPSQMEKRLDSDKIWNLLYNEDGTPTDFHSLESEDVHLYRYSQVHQVLILATYNEVEELMKVYRITLDTSNVTLLYSQAAPEWRFRWVYLALSTDGQMVAAAIRSGSDYVGGGTKYLVWEENELRFQDEDPEMKLRYSDQNETHQFFAAMHPDNQHSFYWMYGTQTLKVVHLKSGAVLKKKQFPSVYAMGISEKGDQLLLSVQNGTFMSYNLPDLEAEFSLDHEIGYDWWGPMGLGINAAGDVAICFEGKDRTGYFDMNYQVADRDSHLVMWQKDAKGRWQTVDAFHFRKGTFDIDAGDPFAIKSIGPNIYFAGLVDSKNIFWMEFPSKKHLLIEAGLGYGDKVHFSADGSEIWVGNSIHNLRGFEVPVSPVTDRAEVMKLHYPRKKAQKPFPQEDWRTFWDPTNGCLNLSGSSIRDLNFLAELPDLVTLILDDCDVLDLPDLSGFQNLRKLCLNKSLIQDFEPVRQLPQLEELSLQENAIANIDWLSEMVGLKKLDLAFSSVLDIGPLAHLRNLEWLSLEKTKIQDISALRGLPIRHLDLTMSKVADLEPIFTNSCLETLLGNHIRLAEFRPSPKWKALKHLSIHGASVDGKLLESLPSLEWLDISRTDLQDFSFLKKLNGLKGLGLEYTAFANLQDISHLNSLEYLNIRDTAPYNGLELLAEMPLKDLRLFGKQFADLRPIGELSTLQRLDIVIDRFVDFGPMVQRLTNLERLFIAGSGMDGCQGSIDFLRPLQKLKWLDLNMGNVDDMAPLASLTALEHLNVSVDAVTKYCSLSPLVALKYLRWRGGYTIGKSIPDIFTGLTNLESFEGSLAAFGNDDFLASWTNLKQLKLDMFRGTRLDFLKYMPKIQSLELSNAMRCDSLADLQHTPDLRHFSLGNWADPEPLFRMERLRTLSLSFSNFPLKALSRLKALRSLSIDGESHSNLKRLPDLPSLTDFSIHDYGGKDLSALENLTRLRTLSIAKCKLDVFPNLQRLTCLEKVELQGVTLTETAGLASMVNLQELTVQYPHFTSFDWLSSLPILRYFSLSIISHRQEKADAVNIDSLFQLKHLQNLSLHCGLLAVIPTWEFLQNVEYAWLELPNLVSVPAEHVSLPMMRELHWQSQQSIDFSFLGSFTGLRKLDIQNPFLTDLSLLSKLDGLRELDISRTGVKTLTPLAGRKRLRQLEFSQTKVRDLEALADMPGLEDIRFEGVPVPSYAPLQNLQHLEWISGDLPADKDLKYLAGKANLSTLMLHKGKISTLEPLFPMIENNQLDKLYMLDTEVEQLPKGLKFDRYDFVKNYKEFIQKKRKKK